MYLCQSSLGGTAEFRCQGGDLKPVQGIIDLAQFPCRKAAGVVGPGVVGIDREHLVAERVASLPVHGTVAQPCLYFKGVCCRRISGKGGIGIFLGEIVKSHSLKAAGIYLETLDGSLVEVLVNLMRTLRLPGV